VTGGSSRDPEDPRKTSEFSEAPPTETELLESSVWQQGEQQLQKGELSSWGLKRND